MAVESIPIEAPPATTRAVPPPYAASWLDRLLDWIEALPGPAPLAYLVLGTVVVVVMYAQPWTLGAASPFTPVEKLYWGGIIGVQLAAAGYVRRVAGMAFDAFRPDFVVSLHEGPQDAAFMFANRHVQAELERRVDRKTHV